jgi:hypothetical protein
MELTKTKNSYVGRMELGAFVRHIGREVGLAKGRNNVNDVEVLGKIQYRNGMRVFEADLVVDNGSGKEIIATYENVCGNKGDNNCKNMILESHMQNLHGVFMDVNPGKSGYVFKKDVMIFC